MTRLTHQLDRFALVLGLAASVLAISAPRSANAQVKADGRMPAGPLHIAPWTLGPGVTGIGSQESMPYSRGAHLRVYENTGTDSLFLAEVQPHRAGDDGSFNPGPGFADPVYIDTVEFGMYVNPGPNGEADFDAYCLFYANCDPNATPVNDGFLGGFGLQFRGIWGEVSYTTGPIDLTPIFPDGIFFPHPTWFVDVRFYEPGSLDVLSGRATPMFAGSGPTVGSSGDIYWRDVNADGHYGPDEARFFGGAPHLANFYLALDGRVVTPMCPCDFNDDHAVTTQDFFDFLGAFFGNAPNADFNGDGLVDSQDFFAFLACFFAGCPG